MTDELAGVQPRPVPTVQPTPVQLTVKCHVVQAERGNAVMLQIFGPTGCAVYFLDVDSAKAISNELRDTAARARSGIIVASQ